MAPRRKERIARNESAFRQLNESLERNVHGSSSADALAGFVCECGDGDCEDIVRMPVEAYEEIREDSRLFFVQPGHEMAEAEDVVRKGDGYFVVRKHVDVAAIADRTDPRNGS